MHYNSEKEKSKAMSAHWVDWIADLISRFGNAYFMSFMFDNIHGNMTSRLYVMQRSMDQFYSNLVTRAVRYTNSERHMHKRPILFASPDLPIYKHTKDNIRDVTINDGLHMHAIAIIPPETRFEHALQIHIAEDDLKYRSRTAIRTIDVQPIEKTPEVVAQYALKAIGRHFDENQILLYPGPRRTKREPKWIDHYSGE